MVGSAVMAVLFGAAAASAQTANGGVAGLPLNPSLGAAPLTTPVEREGTRPKAAEGQGAEANSGGLANMVPPFRAGASVFGSESYVSNAAGSSAGARGDALTTLGLNAYVHEQTQRVSLDANYNGNAYFYANGSVPTQISNYLQATSSLIAIPDYLTFSAKAFAQPVVNSDLGFLTANDRIVPNGYSSSYGYFVSPQLQFRLGDFAVSKSMASYGGVYFDAARGSTTLIPPLFPGFPPTLAPSLGPQDMISRTLTQQLLSGSDFNRFNWSLTAMLSETDQGQRLLAEQAGVGNFSYAILPHLNLLATAGYDNIRYPMALFQKISGPVWLGGLGGSIGSDLNFQFEAGRKYHSDSYYANLSYAITPTLLLTGSADDYVSTPEGQLLNSLTNLTATPTGGLGSSRSLLQNGNFASLAGFDAQPQGQLFDQSLARYQTGMVGLSGDYERNHVNVSGYVMRRTILSGFIIGSPRQDYWGGRVAYTRDINPLMHGTIAAGYSNSQEFSGTARIYNFDASLNYNLSRTTYAYFQAGYLYREPTGGIPGVSPVSGSLSDVILTVGISHTLF